ncbi:nickel-dependent hydrogenase large subunit [Clostridium sp.]|uniref:nickel-dependent hydrogenase large subunit n=1 Tax=Clostridium sp. TaxID=1506 RepID=UPI002612F56B|nr:nickel-dependent hydrogenase large subunit [uncultured Clostridium sp.]
MSSSYIDGLITEIDQKSITEGSAFSWYKYSKASEVPVNYAAETDIKKPGAYTFIRAPRYKGEIVQIGCIVRAFDLF